MKKLHMARVGNTDDAGTRGAAYGADHTPVTDARLANRRPELADDAG